MTQHRGKVKTYIADRGFGFIEPDGGGSDVFVHVNEASEEILVQGTEVTYELELDKTRNRERAVRVRAV